MFAALRRLVPQHAVAFKGPQSFSYVTTDQPQFRLACLEGSRSVLKIHGSQVLQFLQAMVTNDMRLLEQPGCAPVYAALLTPKGKLLHDLLVYRDESGGASSSEESVLVEVDKAGKQSTVDLLVKYKLRRQLSIEDVSSSQRVWVAFGLNPESILTKEPPTQPPGASGHWHADPRLPALGWRGVFQGATAPTSGYVLGDERAYKRWRYQHGVAEGEQEMSSEKAVPLEYSLDVLNGISYKKGCYVGQERVSFSHYRGIIRRRCMPFKLEGAAPSTSGLVGSDVRVQGSGEVVGTVTGHAGDLGLALMKLSTALQAEAGQVVLAPVMPGAEGLAAKGEGIGLRVVPFRPAWWSPEWGKEELGG